MLPLCHGSDLTLSCFVVFCWQAYARHAAAPPLGDEGPSHGPGHASLATALQRSCVRVRAQRSYKKLDQPFRKRQEVQSHRWADSAFHPQLLTTRPLAFRNMRTPHVYNLTGPVLTSHKAVPSSFVTACASRFGIVLKAPHSAIKCCYKKHNNVLRLYK
jgi:hypothetical protein